jgi:hypothetical protein
MKYLFATLIVLAAGCSGGAPTQVTLPSQPVDAPNEKPTKLEARQIMEKGQDRSVRDGPRRGEDASP